ncbi:MAG: hypothetical protein KBD31_00260 [Proteobacteria bacterium]|nr:hypothetical protein [Pseudomonadota bacterium]
MKKVLSLTLSLTVSCFCDVQKNKIVQEAIVKKEDGKIAFYPEHLNSNPKAFKTAVDIFFDRYKKESLDGFIALSATSFSVASCLGYLLNIPVYLASPNKPHVMFDVKEKSKYIIVDDLLDKPTLIENIIHQLEEKKAYVMEICTLTENLKIKTRDKIAAQVMSIFVLRETQN